MVTSNTVLLHVLCFDQESVQRGHISYFSKTAQARFLHCGINPLSLAWDCLLLSQNWVRRSSDFDLVFTRSID